MQRGFVKSWRKSLDNPLFKKPLIWHFWNYCLLKASRKNEDVFINGLIVKIKPGQFVFGRSMAVSETGLTERQVRTAVKHLKTLGNIAVKATNKYSIITIKNWEEYQEKASSKRPANVQQNATQSDQQKNSQKQGQSSALTGSDQQGDQQGDQQVFSGCPKNDHIQEVQEVQEVRSNKLPDGSSSADKSANPKTPPCPHKKIISLYNEILGQALPQCKVTNKTIESNLRARWREDKTRQGLAWWSQFFNDVSESDFLMGRRGEWSADFTWLVRSTNMTKVLNGNYINKKQPPKPKTQPRVSDYSGDYSPEKMEF